MDKQLHEAISAAAREEMELGPLFLALFSGELEAAKQASYDLWVCLCNQGQITPAALPSYGILREGLLTLPQELKVEILDILYQFAVGSSVPGGGPSGNDFWRTGPSTRASPLTPTRTFPLSPG